MIYGIAGLNNGAIYHDGFEEPLAYMMPPVVNKATMTYTHEISREQCEQYAKLIADWMGTLSCQLSTSSAFTLKKNSNPRRPR